jgi:cardiolipin synthase
VKIDGPGVEGLQHVFAEDWDFAEHESLEGERYFPLVAAAGEHVVQIAASGPDQDVNTMRELIFTSITLARKRFWIASPYLVPDLGILDALRSSARAGVDVRLLFIREPDHWLPYYAAYYYLPELLAAGVRVYQYTQGMMHAKYCVVDHDWGWLGSTNLDNRSLRLSFEANCIFHSPELVHELATTFERDLAASVEMDLKEFDNRPFLRRVVENACRLCSPAL